MLNIVIFVNPRNARSSDYPLQLWHEGKPLAEGRARIDQRTLLEHEHAFNAHDYGMELYHALFNGDLAQEYQRLVGSAGAEATVRIQLVIHPDAPELHALPWERIFHVWGNQEVALAATARTPFSRFLMTREGDQPPITERRLRLLVAVANPDGLPPGYAPLDVTGEISALADLFTELRDHLQVTILLGHTELPPELRARLAKLEPEIKVLDGVATSWQAIQRHLSDHHVLHILAHGQFKPGERTAYLLLEHAGDGEHAAGSMDRVADTDIAAGLTGVNPLPHLIFLAACESARRPADDANPFIGLGPKLVQAGVPAVIAMQDLVSMPLARELTGDLYRRIFVHGEVDRALNEARNLLYERDQLEWAVPVLFMRLRDGQLIDPACLPRPLCPYPGMKSFTAKERDQFFGRDAEIAELRQRLSIDVPLIAVIGPSGSGKSSLVMAGLLPKLDPKQWTIRTFEPGADPPEQLRKELEGLVDVDTGKRLDGGATRLLVVVDQLEQIFTATTGQAQRDGFLQDLLRLMTVEKVSTVLTMRSDFYDDLEKSVLWSAVERRRLDLTLPKGDRLREAIIKPAASVGVTVEPALVERLASEAGDEPDTLPFIQETLTWLWGDLEGRELTLRAYDDMIASAQQTGSKAKSGLQMAMALHADKAYNAFKSDETSRIDERRIAERILLRLVQLQDVERLTRRRQTKEELIVRPDEEEMVERVLESLRKEHLITLSSDESGKEVRVDLSHEALVRGWSPLAEWVIKHRDDELFRRELEKDADAWQEEGKELQGLGKLKWQLSSDLYRGKRLRKARDWAVRDSTDVDGAIGAFLDAAQRRVYVESAVLFVLVAALALLVGKPVVREVQIRRWQKLARGPVVILQAGKVRLGQPGPIPAAGETELADPPPRAFPETTVDSSALAMDQYEVSYDRYRLCVRAGACKTVENDPEFANRPGNLPIVKVTAFQANSFCRWIGGRLPTEVEWSALRAAAARVPGRGATNRPRRIGRTWRLTASSARSWGKLYLLMTCVLRAAPRRRPRRGSCTYSAT